MDGKDDIESQGGWRRWIEVEVKLDRQCQENNNGGSETAVGGVGGWTMREFLVPTSGHCVKGDMVVKTISFDYPDCTTKDEMSHTQTQRKVSCCPVKTGHRMWDRYNTDPNRTPILKEQLTSSSLFAAAVRLLGALFK